ncbi:MAG: hypothetical protein F7C38_01330 [Desulfurococcales archaeon]|nr:hypothetical protein [Desulfurococcales archaeon]
MTDIVGTIELRAMECRERLEGKSFNDRWIPRLKSKIAEAIAECIVELLGEDIVEEIYYVDLAGGEVVYTYEGRDVDLIVKVADKVSGLENDIKMALERSLNPILKEAVAWYVSMSGKTELLEVHVITDYSLGYGVLIRSKYSPAIRLWPKKSEERLSFRLI